MRAPTVCLLLLLTTPAARPQDAAAVPGESGPGFDHGHRILGRVLADHVRGDRVDYAALQKERDDLDHYVATLGLLSALDLETWTREQRYAFWINAYNAYTLRIVIDHYPVQSIKNIGGALESVWDKDLIPLGHLRSVDESGSGDEAEKISLNDIEHEILRPRFKDARVHAAVNCASRGCPPLRTEPFLAERLEDQLDEQARAWLADDYRNRYDLENGTLYLSKIFEWFPDDFARDAESIEGWVAKYAPADVGMWLQSAERVEIRHLAYSWKLNDVERK